MSNAGRTFPPEVLSHDEVVRLLEACGRSRIGLRNRALIVTMWRGGLRVSEALALRPKDIDLERGVVRILHGKGDKSRTVGLDAHACSIIQDWVTARDNVKYVGSDSPLFCTLKGTEVHSSYLRRLLPQLAKKAKVWKRVHPHGFRHTHAYELMMEGVPVPIIQRQLGHSNLSTTNRYLDHIAPKDVVEAIRKREW